MIENRFLFPWPHSFSVEDNSGIWQISGWFSILLLMSDIWCNQLQLSVFIMFQQFCWMSSDFEILEAFHRPGKYQEKWILEKKVLKKLINKDINKDIIKINKDIKEIKQVTETLQRPLEHVISFSLAHLALSSLAPVTYAAALSTIVLYYNWMSVCSVFSEPVVIFILLGFCFSFCLGFCYPHSFLGKHIWHSTQITPWGSLYARSQSSLWLQHGLNCDTSHEIKQWFSNIALLRLPGGLFKIHIPGLQPQSFWPSTYRIRPRGLHFKQEPERFLGALILSPLSPSYDMGSHLNIHWKALW